MPRFREAVGNVLDLKVNILTNYDFVGYALAVGTTPRDSMKQARDALAGFTLTIV